MDSILLLILFLSDYKFDNINQLLEDLQEKFDEMWSGLNNLLSDLNSLTEAGILDQDGKITAEGFEMIFEDEKLNFISIAMQNIERKRIRHLLSLIKWIPFVEGTTGTCLGQILDALMDKSQKNRQYWGDPAKSFFVEKDLIKMIQVGLITTQPGILQEFQITKLGRDISTKSRN